jgi:hypothetical protein
VGKVNLDMLMNVTDSTNFGICAKCETANISELASVCPCCEHYLGPVSPLFSDWNTHTFEKREEVHAHICFECTVVDPIGFSIDGDGPTAVASINMKSLLVGGMLRSSYGNQERINSLLRRRLQPIIGDVLVSVNDVNISHFNSIQV